jgi:uncharacterized membrane protein
VNDVPYPPPVAGSPQVQRHLRAAHEAAARANEIRSALRHRRMNAGTVDAGTMDHGTADAVSMDVTDAEVRPVHPREPQPTFGQRAADAAAAIIGSWRFLIVQTLVLGAWLTLNVVAWTHRWDPYPFILLNLVLSFQAAYSAPVLLMSSNRQAEVDREHAAKDYLVNEQAEQQVEQLLQLVQAQLHQNAEILALLQTSSTTHASDGSTPSRGPSDG